MIALQRNARRRLRDELMVIEGVRLVAELTGSTFAPVDVFVTADFCAAGPPTRELIERLAMQTTLYEIPDDLMREMSDTVTPQGILAVVSIPDLTSPQQNRLILIPDQVRDPGNLGTMLRTAWASGVTEVLLPPGAVDHTNPKVVRAAMGAHFALPIHKASWEEIWHSVGSAPVWLAEAHRGQPYDRVAWPDDVAIVIGGEAAGAGQQARDRAKYVHIPMAAGTESLNAAIATAVLLFEVARNRRLACAI